MLKFCFLNGDIIPSEDASVSLNDLALIRGYGIFDFLRTYNSKPFLLDKYLDRFYNSAEKLRLPIEYGKEKLTEIINELLIKNKIDEVGIRLVLTGGESKDSFSIGVPNLFILIEKLPEYPSNYFDEGIKLITLNHQRVLPEIKMTNYLTAISLQPLCLKQNAQDILYVYNGCILETTRSNFFMIKDSKVVTPKEDVLIGRTRNFVLEIATKLYPVEERLIKKDEILEADEIFITGTTKQIMPVAHIDRTQIKNSPGPITRQLMKAFNDFVGKF